MANCSSIFAWKIPETRESGGLPFMESQELDKTKQLNMSIATLRSFQLL